MCPKTFISRILSAAVAAGLLASVGSFAQAQEIQIADSTKAPGPVTGSTETLTIGYQTPAYGTVAVGVPAYGTRGGLGIGEPFGFNSTYSTRVLGANVGVFGGVAERPSILALAPAVSRNMGALVGYAGFYLRGGVNDTPQLSPFFRAQGWEAGFGYETGAIDLRLTYASSQNANAFGSVDRALDSQQWTLGGIYQISPRLRLNADAFYGIRDNHGVYFSLPSTAPQTPQGTGARVGIQLRF